MVFEVFSNVVEPLGLRQHNQHTSSTFTISVTTDGAIAEISTWRAFPCGIHQSFPGIFPRTDLSPQHSLHSCRSSSCQQFSVCIGDRWSQSSGCTLYYQDSSPLCQAYSS